MERRNIDSKGKYLHSKQVKKMRKRSYTNIGLFMLSGVVAIILFIGLSSSIALASDGKYYEYDKNPYNPANKYDPKNPLNPANKYDKNNMYNPANKYDSKNPLNPANKYNKENPFNPANKYDPKNPLNPANKYNLNMPLKPIKK